MSFIRYTREAFFSNYRKQLYYTAQKRDRRSTFNFINRGQFKRKIKNNIKLLKKFIQKKVLNFRINLQENLVTSMYTNICKAMQLVPVNETITNRSISEPNKLTPAFTSDLLKKTQNSRRNYHGKSRYHEIKPLPTPPDYLKLLTLAHDVYLKDKEALANVSINIKNSQLKFLNKPLLSQVLSDTVETKIIDVNVLPPYTFLKKQPKKKLKKILSKAKVIKKAVRRKKKVLTQVERKERKLREQAITKLKAKAYLKNKRRHITRLKVTFNTSFVKDRKFNVVVKKRFKYIAKSTPLMNCIFKYYRKQKKKFITKKYREKQCRIKKINLTLPPVASIVKITENTLSIIKASAMPVIAENMPKFNKKAFFILGHLTLYLRTYLEMYKQWEMRRFQIIWTLWNKEIAKTLYLQVLLQRKYVKHRRKVLKMFSKFRIKSKRMKLRARYLFRYLNSKKKGFYTEIEFKLSRFMINKHRQLLFAKYQKKRKNLMKKNYSNQIKRQRLKHRRYKKKVKAAVRRTLNLSHFLNDICPAFRFIPYHQQRRVIVPVNKNVEVIAKKPYIFNLSEVNGNNLSRHKLSVPLMLHYAALRHTKNSKIVKAWLTSRLPKPKVYKYYNQFRKGERFLNNYKNVPVQNGKQYKSNNGYRNNNSSRKLNQGRNDKAVNNAPIIPLKPRPKSNMDEEFAVFDKIKPPRDPSRLSIFDDKNSKYNKPFSEERYSRRHFSTMTKREAVLGGIIFMNTLGYMFLLLQLNLFSQSITAERQKTEKLVTELLIELQRARDVPIPPPGWDPWLVCLGVGFIVLAGLGIGWYFHMKLVNENIRLGNEIKELGNEIAQLKVPDYSSIISNKPLLDGISTNIIQNPTFFEELVRTTLAGPVNSSINTLTSVVKELESQFRSLTNFMVRDLPNKLNSIHQQHKINSEITTALCEFVVNMNDSLIRLIYGAASKESQSILVTKLQSQFSNLYQSLTTVNINLPNPAILPPLNNMLSGIANINYQISAQVYRIPDIIWKALPSRTAIIQDAVTITPKVPTSNVIQVFRDIQTAQTLPTIIEVVPTVVETIVQTNPNNLFFIFLFYIHNKSNKGTWRAQHYIKNVHEKFLK